MRAIVKGFVIGTVGLIQKGELRMHKSVVLTMAAMLVVAAAALPKPAAATTAAQAMKLCDQRASKTNDCNYSMSDNGDVTVCVGKNCGGGIVECPRKGNCMCMTCPARKAPDGRSIAPADIQQILQGESPPPGPGRVRPPVAPAPAK